MHIAKKFCRVGGECMHLSAVSEGSYPCHWFSIFSLCSLILVNTCLYLIQGIILMTNGNAECVFI